MSGGKEIKGQISSIKNTQKITKAMEMVAASKMKKAQSRMAAARPYAKMIKNVVGHLASAHPEYKHPFLVKREKVKRVGLIIISTDRGLCGGLNTNLFKQALKQINEWNKNSIEVDVCAIGSKAEKFFKRLNVNLVAQVSHLGDSPEINDVIGSIKIMLDNFTDEKIDELHLAENKFINTMSQEPGLINLLPTEPDLESDLSHHWDYILSLIHI